MERAIGKERNGMEWGVASLLLLVSSGPYGAIRVSDLCLCCFLTPVLPDVGWSGLIPSFIGLAVGVLSVFVVRLFCLRENILMVDRDHTGLDWIHWHGMAWHGMAESIE